MSGGDYILASHTGSGKTLAYLLPIVSVTFVCSSMDRGRGKGDQGAAAGQVGTGVWVVQGHSFPAARCARTVPGWWWEGEQGGRGGGKSIW